MQTLQHNRIESIDLLKGLVMVIMALDHTRDYFHIGSFLFDPTDPGRTSVPIYFTRWITHFCAPTFSFLAGISAFLSGRRKTKSQLSGFLIKRGLWLVLMELTVVNFGWFFDIQFHNFSLIVIWALGVSMIVLGGLVHLPKKAILAISCLIILGHDLLNGLHFNTVLWAIIHDCGFFESADGYKLMVGYPIIPWIAVMSLGYCFGSLYDRNFDAARRKNILNTIGIAAVALFVVVRYSNLYGDPMPWKDYPLDTQDAFSFMNPNKYPPSLMYLLMTLGAALLFLAHSEKLQGKVVDFFSTFGRVPFFYYILHIYVIHILAMLFAALSGGSWRAFILTDWVSEAPALKGYGFALWVVYAVWIAVIALTYPLCKRFDIYKQNHKEKWWLAYL